MKLIQNILLNDYRQLIFEHKFNCKPRCGQYVKINEKYFSIMDSEDNSFSILVKPFSTLHNDKELIVSEPIGDELKNIYNEKTIVLAEGTAISNAINLIKNRILFNFFTELHFFSNYKLNIQKLLPNKLLYNIHFHKDYENISDNLKDYKKEEIFIFGSSDFLEKIKNYLK